MRAISKHIPIDTMPMKIQIHNQPFPIIFGQAHCHAHKVSNRGNQHLALFEPAVEILACEAGPVVAQDHAVRVQHRHDLED